jgi:hypothetical protein
MNPVDEELAAKSQVFLKQIFDVLINTRLSGASDKVDKLELIDVGVQKHLRKFLENHLPLALYLEIFTTIEGCHPLLLEKWTLRLTHSNSNSYSPSDCETFLKEIQKLATKIPTRDSSNLDSNFTVVSLKSWQKHEKFVEKEPKNPLNLFLKTLHVEVFSEFLSDSFLPEIKEQDLGPRPRLSSIEMAEPVKIDGELFANDEPIVCLGMIKVLENFSPKNCELTTKMCNKEHSLIGFAPLSHTICSETASNTSVSPFSLNSDEVLNETNLPEDAAISLYKLACERLLRSNLFQSPRCPSKLSLQNTLHSMRRTLDLL